MNKKILFFSDFGVDDMVAVIFTYFSNELDVVGFVADYGNVSKESAIRNVRYFQDLTSIYNIPIFGGAVIPLTGENPVYYHEIHGPSGLGPIIPKLYPNSVLENFFGILDVINQYEGELIIFSAGRLTSLATLFILYPEAMKKVKAIYMMGGAFNTPGNVTPVAEANIHSDPYAANLVLQLSPIKIHIIPLDVTRHAILTPDMINRLDDYYKQTNNQVGKIIKPMVNFYYDFYKKREPNLIGSPLHDLLALWAVLDQSNMKYVDVPVNITVGRDESFGQSIGDFRKVLKKSPWPVHHVAQSFQYQEFVQQVFTILASRPRI